MKNPKEMSDVQLLKWLKKTAKSLGNAYNASDDRRYSLIDRYEDLMEEAKERDIWRKYCKENNCSVYHDGYDCMA